MADVANLQATLGLNAVPFISGLRASEAQAAAFSVRTRKLMLGTIGAAAALGGAIIAIGISFESADNKIRVATGATGKSLEGLQESFRNVARGSAAPLGDVADAIGSVNQRLGLTGGPLETVTERMIKLSRITGTDLTGNIREITRSFGDWGVAVEDMPGSMDKLFRASQISGASVADLAQNITAFGAPLRTLGFNMDEATAMFARFEKEGVNTSTVMAGMRQAVKNFGSGLAEQETGVSTFEEALAGVRDGTFDITDAMSLFGARAGTDVFRAMQEGRFELEDYVDTIANGSDTILAAADDTRTLAGRLSALKNRAFVNLEPIATAALDAITAGLDWVLEAFNNLDPGIKKILGLLAGFGAAAIFIGAIGSVIAMVIAACAAWVVALVAIAAALVYAYQESETFRAVVQTVWEWLQQAGEWVMDEFVPMVVDGFAFIVAWVRANWPAIRDTISAVMNGVRAVISTVVNWAVQFWNTFGSTILAYAVGAWNAIRQVIHGAINFIMGIVRTVMAIIRGDWGAAWEGIKQAARGVWESINGMVDGAINMLKTAVRVGMTVVAGIFSGIWETIKGAFGAVWRAIVRIATDRVNAAKQVISGVWNTIKSVTSRVWEGIKGAVRRALDGITNGVRGARDAIGRIWEGLKAVFKAPLVGVLGIVRLFLRGLRAIAGIVGLGGLIDPALGAVGNAISTVQSFHSGGIVGGSGEQPAVLLGGEGVLSRDAMAKLGPKKFGQLNKDGRIMSGQELAMFTDQAWGIGGLPGAGVITGGGIGGYGGSANISADIVAVAGWLRDAASWIGDLGGAAAGGGAAITGQLIAGLARKPLDEVRDWVAEELPKMRAAMMTDIVSVGRAMQDMGYSVGEHPAFGGVSPVHTDNSYHYRNRAIDVNWYPSSEEMGRLDYLEGWIHDNLKASQITELLWREAGHYDHLHLAMAKGGAGTVTKPTTFLAGEAGAEDFFFRPHRTGGGGGGGSTIEVHVHGRATRQDGQAVVDALVQWQRSNGRLPVRVKG